jgi:NAD(P)-dependent dehydrogenase (short-subunit alcohol dehydrogenase family)
MEFENRVALITGAGSGIGKATALLLARQGAKIAALGHTEDELKETVDEISRSGGKAIILVADISEVSAMKAAYEKLEKEFGRLDIVFANAGINGVWTPLEEMKPEEWDMTINVNLRGTYLTVKYAIPLLKRQGGSIIITSSVNGTRIFSNTGATAYSCTKAAQVAFTQMMALELAHYRIRVNAVCPGAISTSIDENTEQRNREKVLKPVKFPEGKVPLTDGEPGKSEQVADLVAFLASDRSSHITGTPIWIDGAESLIMG